MRNTFKKTTLSLALATGLIGSTVWSTAAQACASDPYISSVCVMALRSAYSFDGYLPATGTQLSVGQYQAVFSLIGNTYGGDGVNNFKLPDLRGRVILGAGTYTDKNGSQNYLVGQTGGAVSQPLTLAQLPQHTHLLAGATVDISKMTATTTLSGLTTTTDLSKISFTSSSSNLTLKAANAAAATTNPTAGSALSTVGFPNAKLYGASTPDTALASTSITGTVSGTLSGNAPGTVSGGSATTTLGGTASVSGGTSATGSATASVPTMTPYLVMNYYFATLGIYPVNNN